MVGFFEFGLFDCEMTLTLDWFGFMWCVNLCAISLVLFWVFVFVCLL